MRLTEVAGANLEHPIRQAKRRNRRLYSIGQFNKHLGCLLWCRHRKNFDFVELVRAQHATRVAARRTRLTTKTRSVRHVAQRQFFGFERFARMQTCQRNLSSRYAPQVVAFDRKRIVGKFRQLTSCRQRACQYQTWWTNLFERIGVAVECELT